MRALAARPKAELLWASPRELLKSSRPMRSVVTSSRSATMSSASSRLIGKDLDEYSLETVKMFHRDALPAGFKIAAPATSRRLVDLATPQADH